MKLYRMKEAVKLCQVISMVLNYKLKDVFPLMTQIIIILMGCKRKN